MREINRFLESYDITASDIESIIEISPLLQAKKTELVDSNFEKLLKNSETARVLRNKKVLEKSKAALLSWLGDFLSGRYSDGYYHKIAGTGCVFARAGLPEHVISAIIANTRVFLTDQIFSYYSDSPEKAVQAVSSVNKALDLNLGLMTRSCHEEEMDTHFISYRLDSVIIRIAKWFVTGFNLLLIFGLLGIGFLALVLVANDVHHMIYAEGGLARGVLGALGTLLILWVIIELLDTQISHIRGQAFAIKIFVSVALVAELRKVLISSIEHTTWEQQAIIASSVLVLGIVYWLISKVDQKF